MLSCFLGSAPSNLDPSAHVAVACALSKLGRFSGALHLLIELVENTFNAADRQDYLEALARFLHHNGRDARPCFLEAVSLSLLQRAPEPNGCSLDFTPTEPLALVEQVSLFELCGGSVPWWLYAGACKRDLEWSRHLGQTTRFPAGILLDAIDEFGPWVESSVLVTDRFLGNSEALSRLSEWGLSSCGYEFPRTHRVKNNGFVALALSALNTGSVAAVHFLCGEYTAALHLVRRYLGLLDRVRPHMTAAPLKGIVAKDVATVAMVGILSLERSRDLDTDLAAVLLDRLVDPDALSTPPSRDSCQSAPPALRPLPPPVPPLHGVPPLRKSQYFLCCGHALRHAALADASQVTVAAPPPSFSLVKYPHEPLVEAARKYILAACCHPDDDPQIAVLFDRVLWCLLLAGGIHARALWHFFLARNYAVESTFFAPVALTSAPPTAPLASALPLYPATLSPWPRYANAASVLHKVYDFCQMIHSASVDLPPLAQAVPHLLFLCPLVYELEDGRLAYVADRFYPGSPTFTAAEDHLLVPQLRPRIKLAPPRVRDRVAASEDLVRLWASGYADHHGSIPVWADESVTWAESSK